MPMLVRRWRCTRYQASIAAARRLGPRTGRVIEQLAAQAAWNSLSSRCGGCWAGSAVGDALSRQIGRTAPPASPEPVVNCLPLSVSTSPGTSNRRRARRTPGTSHGGRSGHDLAYHAEPGVLIHAGDQLGRVSSCEEDPAYQVHLPQRHRRVPLPPHVTVRAAACGAAGSMSLCRSGPGARSSATAPATPRPGPARGPAAGDPTADAPAAARTPTASISALTWRGDDGGCWYWSIRPPRPSRSYRRTQACTLCRETSIPLGDLGHRNTGSGIQDRPVTLLDHDNSTSANPGLPPPTPANDMRQASRLSRHL